MARREEFQLGAISHRHMLAMAHADATARMLYGEAGAIVEGGKARYHERENLGALYAAGSDYFNKREKIKATAKAEPRERLMANSQFYDKTWGKES